MYKKNINTVIVFLFVLFLVAAFNGCGSDGADNSGSDSGTAKISGSDGKSKTRGFELNGGGSGTSDLSQGQRTALIIGNADYINSPLNNPVNDATGMAGVLKKLGFDVILLKNANLPKIEDALTEFNRELRRGGLGLFYFAGHGIQFEGENYLLPVDFDADRPQDLRYKAMPVGRVLGAMEDAANGVNIMLLDACRNNPYASSYRSATRGLAVVQSVQGSLIAYATEPGGVAIDGDGQNGIYTKHLMEQIQKPGVPLEQMLKQVRIGVQEETGGKQTPWESSSLTSDIFLMPAAPSSGGSSHSSGPSNDNYNSAPDSAIEAQAWAMVKDSNDPGNLRAFLNSYPNGKFAALAELKLKMLEPDENDQSNGNAGSSGSSGVDLETEMWNIVKDSEKASDFQYFLNKYPKGKFAPLARLKIKMLEPDSGVKKQTGRTDYTAKVQANDPDYKEANRFIKRLRSTDPAEKQRAAKELYKSKLRTHPAVLKAAAEELLNGHNLNSNDRHHVDAMDWICNILGASGDPSYSETLRRVIRETRNAKIKKYAQKNYNRLR